MSKKNIIAIASGKGGVGKTWLSATLSAVIARSGRKVLLFDGDLGLANVDIQLGLTPARDLGSVISGRATLSEVITKLDNPPVDIIAGRSGSGTLANLAIEKLENLGDDIQDISNNYDATFLDLGAGVENHVRYLSKIASKCLVVVTDEPTSLTDAYAFIKLCLQDSPDIEIQIVVNQAGTQKEGEKTYETISKACQNFLKFSPKLAGVIRRDNKVKDSIRSQTSIVVKYPNTTAATDVAALAVKLMAK